MITLKSFARFLPFFSVFCNFIFSNDEVRANIVYKADVSLCFDSRFSGDTIYVDLSSKVLDPLLEFTPSALPSEEFKFVLNKHGFVKMTFLLPGKYCYFSVSRNIVKESSLPYPIMDGYLLKSGDNIEVRISADSICKPGPIDIDEIEKHLYQMKFSGFGSQRFSYYYFLKMPVLPHIQTKIGRFVNTFDTNGRYNVDNNFHSELLWLLQNVSERFSKMDSVSSNICRADLLGIYYRNLGRDARGNKRKKPLIDFDISRYREEIQFTDTGLNDFEKFQSKAFAEGVLELEEAAVSLTGSLDYSTLYYHLRDHYGGLLREKLLTLCLIHATNLGKADVRVVNDYSSVVKDLAFRKFVGRNSNKEPGALAYNFRLQDSGGNTVSLESLRGKYVFVDVYFTGCSGCSNFYHLSVRDLEERYKNDSRICFVSISIDGDRSIWVNSLNSGAYTSVGQRNVLNLYTNGEGSNNGFVRNYELYAFPVQAFIDPDGKIIEFNKDIYRADQQKLANLLSDYLVKGPSISNRLN